MALSVEKGDVQLGVLGELLGYRLRRAQLAFFNSFSETCADLGISPGLFAVVSIVQCNPGLTQTAVAQALGTDRSAMVAAIDKLEALNLIERRTSKRDRRSYALYMTEFGEQWFVTASLKVRDHEASFDHLLRPGEKALLLDILDRLANPNRHEQAKHR